VSVHPLVRMEKKKSAPTGRIFKKFGIWEFLENLPRKFKCH
jgi:hypothetical protein